MTNNIEQIEELLILYGTEEYDTAFYSKPGYSSMARAYRDRIMDIVKSMQSQIDALTKEADADESRESEIL